MSPQVRITLLKEEATQLGFVASTERPITVAIKVHKGPMRTYFSLFVSIWSRVGG